MTDRASLGAEELVISVLGFEHRYVPWEGMRRFDVFERVANDLKLDGLTPDEALQMAGPRVVDLVREAITIEAETSSLPEASELTDEEIRELTVGRAAAVAWCEGLLMGVFHTYRLISERGMPNAER
jgi:hypothetical protein